MASLNQRIFKVKQLLFFVTIGQPGMLERKPILEEFLNKVGLANSSTPIYCHKF